MNQEGYSFFTGFNEEFLEYIRGYINETNDEIIHRLKSKLHQENITPVVELPRLCRSRGFLDLFFCATCLFGVLSNKKR